MVACICKGVCALVHVHEGWRTGCIGAGMRAHAQRGCERGVCGVGGRSIWPGLAQAMDWGLGTSALKDWLTKGFFILFNVSFYLCF